MELRELVFEIIDLLKEGPYKVKILSSNDLFREASTLTLPDKNWFDKKRNQLQNIVGEKIHDLKELLKSCQDVSLVEEELEKVKDTVFLIKEDKLIAKNNKEFMKFKKEEIEAYEYRIEAGNHVIEVLTRKFKNLKQANEKLQPESGGYDFDLSSGLTDELKIDKIRVNMSGADLAFYMHFFKEAGWFKYYENKELDIMFSRVLEQNMKVFYANEYLFLKHFQSKLSYAKGVESDDINVKREKQFKEVLERTITKARNTFLKEE